MSLGKQIVSYRNTLGYSQEELSQFSGISLRTIQRIEKGVVHPRGHTLRALAECLKVELSVLKTEVSPVGDEVAKKARALNSLGLLVILLPFVSTVIQVVYWIRNKHLLASHLASRKVVSFQILWAIAVLFSMSLIHIVTYLLTGQSVYGQFPIRMTVYILLLLTNVSIVVHSAAKLNHDSPLLLRRVPVLI